MSRRLLTVSLIIGLSLSLYPGGSLFSLEHLITTGDLIGSSPHVARVRVDGHQSAGSSNRIVDYRVTVLENLKGRLPNYLTVRVLTASRIANPSGRIDRPGTEWIVILGNKNRAGLYPLRSLHWGRIEIYKDPGSGEKRLARPLSGMRDGRGKRHFSLNRFREQVMILKRRGKRN